MERELPFPREYKDIARVLGGTGVGGDVWGRWDMREWVFVCVI